MSITAATTATAALQGTTTTSSVSSTGNNNGASAIEDLNNMPPPLISIQDRKDDALRVLKSDLMDALNKEVKSLDEDEWMFEGPRSRINLISRPGGSFTMKSSQISKEWNLTMPQWVENLSLEHKEVDTIN
ncbi:hypothetical protein Ancab_033035 [Ancistrocladus abbreviatus]